MSVGGIARGGLFLFAGLMIGSMLGYIYWFIVSAYGGAEVVGIASSIVSLSSIVSGIAMLGIPMGVQRFLGRDFSHKKTKGLSKYFWTSFTFSIALCFLSALIMWIVYLLGIPFIGFSENMLILSTLIVSLGFSGAISALFVSIIRTQFIALSYVGSEIIKLGLGLFLVYQGFGWFGAVLGVIFDYLSFIVLLLFFALRELRRLGAVEIHLSTKALRESLRAGFVSWLPAVTALLGQQLSVLMVFGIQGGLETGAYFVDYLIFSIAYMLPTSLISILFPVLSGLADSRRKKVTWKTVKICLAFVCPLAAFLILYSTFPLSLMGKDYVQSAPSLSLLAASTVPLTFVLAVTNFAYSLGLYGKVLGIGLATNVTRVMLYFLLVPAYGGFGAALSFLLGAATGLVVAVYVSKVTEFQVYLSKVIITVITPLAAAVLCYSMGLNWFVGGIVILLTSVFSYGRLGVIERGDIAEIARAFASEKTIARAGQRLGWVLRIIYGE